MKSSYTFNRLIDTLPTSLEWLCDEITVMGDLRDSQGRPLVEKVNLWRRRPLDCIRELISNPAFKERMRFAPEKIFEDEELLKRIINEMWTGDWWWDVQVSHNICW